MTEMLREKGKRGEIEDLYNKSVAKKKQEMIISLLDSFFSTTK